MKKRFILYALFFSVMFILITHFSNAEELVCGHTADSLQGYGQVSIMSVIYSCNNVPDGVCPEDYQDYNLSFLFGNCLRCTDPDCTGNVSGTVYNSQGTPLPRATVKALPLRWNSSAPSMEKTVITDSSGKFNLSGVATGNYYFSAAQEGYDTQLLEVSVSRNQLISNVAFNLANGTCFDDCTNSYGRCNAQCQGINFSNGQTCDFFDNKTVNAASLCNNRPKDTEVMVPDSFNGTHAQFINCCEGRPYWKYYQQAAVSTSSIKNLAKVEKLVKYNDQPVRIIIAYWPSEYDQ